MSMSASALGFLDAKHDLIRAFNTCDNVIIIIAHVSINEVACYQLERGNTDGRGIDPPRCGKAVAQPIKFLSSYRNAGGVVTCPLPNNWQIADYGALATTETCDVIRNCARQHKRGSLLPTREDTDGGTLDIRYGIRGTPSGSSS